MAYCDISKVEARNPIRGAFTTSSKPNASQVYVFIDEAAGIIDTLLTQAGYEAPIATSTAASSALSLLEYCNAVGGWYFAEWAAPTSDRRQEAEDMWESAQKMLRGTQLDLPKDAGESNPRQGTIASPPFFTRTMDL